MNPLSRPAATQPALLGAVRFVLAFLLFLGAPAAGFDAAMAAPCVEGSQTMAPMAGAMIDRDSPRQDQPCPDRDCVQDCYMASACGSPSVPAPGAATISLYYGVTRQALAPANDGPRSFGPAPPLRPPIDLS